MPRVHLDLQLQLGFASGITLELMFSAMTEMNKYYSLVLYICCDVKQNDR